jgi:hypothetical protein
MNASSFSFVAAPNHYPCLSEMYMICVPHKPSVGMYMHFMHLLLQLLLKEAGERCFLR